MHHHCCSARYWAAHVCHDLATALPWLIKCLPYRYTSCIWTLFKSGLLHIWLLKKNKFSVLGGDEPGRLKGVDQNVNLFWDQSEQLSQPYSFNNDRLLTGNITKWQAGTSTSVENLVKQRGMPFSLQARQAERQISKVIWRVVWPRMKYHNHPFKLGGQICIDLGQCRSSITVKRAAGWKRERLCEKM